MVKEEEEEEEKNLTSTPEKGPPTLAPPQLAQLRTENADSFDMEEVHVIQVLLGSPCLYLVQQRVLQPPPHTEKV